MLNICRETHEELTYSGPVCPACLIIAHFTEKLKERDERIEMLEGDLEEVINGQKTSIPIH